MPTAPPRTCARCRAPIPKGTRCPCRPAWQGSTHPGGTRRSQQARAQQLRDHPMCQTPGCPRLATDVDHITPLAEGGNRFDRSNLQSLCDQHHKQKTNTDARRGKHRRR
jgi:5-methylcytosine-specific restriction protein A